MGNGLNMGRGKATRGRAEPPILGPQERRLRLPKAGELVARELRSAIIRGTLKEGDMLPSEPDLVQRFGISRPTLREAIRILESEQLIETTRGLHGGARVMKPNTDVAARYFGNLLQVRGISLSDVYRTRVLIEPAAVRILAQERRPEAVAALRECLRDAEESIASTQSALAFSRFHRIIVEQAGIETLVLLMNMLTTILDRYLLAVASVLGRNDEAHAEARRAHRARCKLVDLIEAGDGEEAATLWGRYLQEAQEKLHRWQPSPFIVDLFQNDQ